MTGSRDQIADALRDALDAKTWDVRAKPLPISQPQAAITGVIVVERQTITPGPAQGLLSEDHHLWVIQPSKDPQVIEDRLDQNLEDVLTVIRTLPWMAFQSANRSTFQDEYHAWDITVQVATTIESE